MFAYQLTLFYRQTHYSLMKRILFVFCFLLAPLLLFAEPVFTMAEVFGDHMVLQRHARVKIWGTAPANTTVQVLFNGQKKRTTAVDGHWAIVLKPMEHGGPYTMEAKCGAATIIFKDVMMGDVWLAGGQSNMEFALRRVKDASDEISRANFPLIRYYKVPRRYYPGHSVNGESWRLCTPQSAGDFSAVAYYFARNINKELGIPVGIVQAPVGGTTAEAWVSKETLLSDVDFLPALKQYDSIMQSYKNGEYETLYSAFNQQTAVYEKLSADVQKKQPKPVEPMGPYNFRRPNGMFENMLRAVMPYTLKGFIFYQGESNTGRGVQYRKLFPALIKEWRDCWKQGDIPFLFIQLPKFDTKTRNWAELREAQYLTSKKIRNTGMAVAFDQGNPRDIHPIVKDTVGWRLSQLALGQVYGKKIVYQGPEFRSMKKDKKDLILGFTGTGSGLIVKGRSNEIFGFTVAGSDGIFYPVKALREGNNVRLVCDEINNPAHVRYLWVNSLGINLFNKEGFPALPFRTDHYRLSTEN